MPRGMLIAQQAIVAAEVFPVVVDIRLDSLVAEAVASPAEAAAEAAAEVAKKHKEYLKY